LSFAEPKLAAASFVLLKQTGIVLHPRRPKVVQEETPVRTAAFSPVDPQAAWPFPSPSGDRTLTFPPWISLSENMYHKLAKVK
jgi:hypothetical protein